MKICSIEDCAKTARARGLCINHYRRWQRHGDPLGGMHFKTTCEVEDCTRPHDAKGFCKMHYNRAKAGAKADAQVGLRIRPTFWGQVDKSGECWEWTGRLDRDGYGRFSTGEGTVLAHRISWEKARGPIGIGNVIDHLCHNTACVNPDHLREVTQFENMQNRKGPVAGGSSGYLNVHKTKTPGLWQVRVMTYGVQHHGGYFTDVDEANEAAIALRAKVHTT